MSTLGTLSPDDLTAFRQQVQSRYDEFKRRGLKLDLTRGKPSCAARPVDGLLALPGAGDYRAADRTDTRNYGVLQGLPELRALLAPLFGARPEQVILGDNSSLALMHDAIVYALLFGHGRQPAALVEGAAGHVPVPVAGLRPALRHLRGVRHRDDPGPADGRRPGHGRRRGASSRDDAGIKGMWCVPKYSNPTGDVYSTRPSSGSRRCRRRRPTSASSGTTPTPSTT